MKLLIVDTETTGLDPKKNGIVQLSAILCTPSGTFEFNKYCNPGDVEISQEALDTNGLTREQIATFENDVDVYFQFTKWLGTHISKYDKTDKAFMAGYNVGFDDGFIRALADKAGDKYLGSYKYNDTIDARAMAVLVLYNDRNDMVNFKLTTVFQKIAGVSVDEYVKKIGVEGGAHNALVDCYLTLKIIHLCCVHFGLMEIAELTNSERVSKL